MDVPCTGSSDVKSVSTVVSVLLKAVCDPINFSCLRSSFMYLSCCSVCCGPVLLPASVEFMSGVVFADCNDFLGLNWIACGFDICAFCVNVEVTPGCLFA